MSKLSALDNLYTLGIKDERTRVRNALAFHLDKVHGWNEDAIASAFVDLGLDQDPWSHPVRKDCIVCGKQYDTEVIPKQTMHAECAESIDKIAQKITKEK